MTNRSKETELNMSKRPMNKRHVVVKQRTKSVVTAAEQLNKTMRNRGIIAMTERSRDATRF